MINAGYLKKFMRHYWMQTADLVFRDLSHATEEMIKSESKEFQIGLLSELSFVDSQGLLPEDDNLSAAQEIFWEPMGGRWLNKSEASKLMTEVGTAALVKH